MVEQNYDKYTPIDHAVWRFVLRQLKKFLSVHAHESYLDGLIKTGIEIESIPKISDISKKIEKFGWRAIPVSGFIPPAAFMELQSLGVLPIASDMRSVEHLLYTPAPDIVHEAAGHAPILIHPEFAEYLRQYAQVAKKAIISFEDLNLYEAIRVLSDVKENSGSTADEIKIAAKNLAKISKNMSHVSEATLLGRMNWWTAEYGLIGSMQNPKIFGAGLLSSVGESKWCLSDKVKRIPLSIECIHTSYDITEPQPQLFVAKDFKHLSQVLEELANQMAFRQGGKAGLDKIITALTVNTVELDSGLQISGVLQKYRQSENGEISYLHFQGPTQLSYQNEELQGHSKKYHQDGFGSPIGPLKKSSTLDLNQNVQIDFESGVQVNGKLIKKTTLDNKLLLLSFKNCKVTLANDVLFDPAWGTYDMALGLKIPSVYAGPADRNAFGDTEDFVARRVPQMSYSIQQLELQKLYQQVRELRENKNSNTPTENQLEKIEKIVGTQFASDWLIQLELFELATYFCPDSDIHNRLESRLKKMAVQKNLINDGIQIASQI